MVLYIIRRTGVIDTTCRGYDVSLQSLLYNIHTHVITIIFIHDLHNQKNIIIYKYIFYNINISY